MSEEHTVQLAPEPVLEIGGFVLTNTQVASILVSVILITLAIFVRRKAGIVPSRLQVLFEIIFLFFYEKIEEGIGSVRARKLTPLVVTLFLIILFSNQFILLPLVSSVVTPEGEFFRTPTTDYSMTIALALLVVVLSHVVAFIISPLGHVGNYLRLGGFFQILRGQRPVKELFNVFIDFFLGLLEIIGDLGRIISLATRLFGNIFSGEVVIIIVMSLMFATQFLVPIPFIVLAVFAGLIQAFVFSLLTVLFISNNIIHASHGDQH